LVLNICLLQLYVTRLQVENIPEKLKATFGTCTNRYGQRTANFCSHVVTCLLYIKAMYQDIEIKAPNPKSRKAVSNLLDNAKWIKKLNEMDAKQQNEYLSHIISTKSWIQELPQMAFNSEEEQQSDMEFETEEDQE